MKNTFKAILSISALISIIFSMSTVSVANTFTTDSLKPSIQNDYTSERHDYYSMPEQTIYAQYTIYPENVSELEKYSDIIIEGSFLNIGEQEVIRSSFGDIIEGYTWSTVEVTNIHKGNLSSGDTITICEPFYMVEEDGTDVIYHNGSYYPSEEGRQYIWFLNDRQTPDGKQYHSLVRAELGRYPLLNSKSRTMRNVFDMSLRDLDLSPSGGAGHFRTIYADVAKKYMDISPTN